MQHSLSSSSKNPRNNNASASSSTSSKSKLANTLEPSPFTPSAHRPLSSSSACSSSTKKQPNISQMVTNYVHNNNTNDQSQSLRHLQTHAYQQYSLSMNSSDQQALLDGVQMTSPPSSILNCSTSQQHLSSNKSGTFHEAVFKSTTRKSQIHHLQQLKSAYFQQHPYSSTTSAFSTPQPQPVATIPTAATSVNNITSKQSPGPQPGSPSLQNQLNVVLLKKPQQIMSIFDHPKLFQGSKIGKDNLQSQDRSSFAVDKTSNASNRKYFYQPQSSTRTSLSQNHVITAALVSSDSIVNCDNQISQSNQCAKKAKQQQQPQHQIKINSSGSPRIPMNVELQQQQHLSSTNRSIVNNNNNNNTNNSSNAKSSMQLNQRSTGQSFSKQKKKHMSATMQQYYQLLSRSDPPSSVDSQTQSPFFTTSLPMQPGIHDNNQVDTIIESSKHHRKVASMTQNTNSSGQLARATIDTSYGPLEDDRLQTSNRSIRNTIKAAAMNQHQNREQQGEHQLRASLSLSPQNMQWNRNGFDFSKLVRRQKEEDKIRNAQRIRVDERVTAMLDGFLQATTSSIIVDEWKNVTDQGRSQMIVRALDEVIGYDEIFKSSLGKVKQCVEMLVKSIDDMVVRQNAQIDGLRQQAASVSSEKQQLLEQVEQLRMTVSEYEKKEQQQQYRQQQQKEAKKEQSRPIAQKEAQQTSADIAILREYIVEQEQKLAAYKEKEATMIKLLVAVKNSGVDIDSIYERDVIQVEQQEKLSHLKKSQQQPSLNIESSDDGDGDDQDEKSGTNSDDVDDDSHGRDVNSSMQDTRNQKVCSPNSRKVQMPAESNNALADESIINDSDESSFNFYGKSCTGRSSRQSRGSVHPSHGVTAVALRSDDTSSALNSGGCSTRIDGEMRSRLRLNLKNLGRPNNTNNNNEQAYNVANFQQQSQLQQKYTQAQHKSQQHVKVKYTKNMQNQQSQHPKQQQQQQFQFYEEEEKIEPLVFESKRRKSHQATIKQPTQQLKAVYPAANAGAEAMINVLDDLQDMSVLWDENPNAMPF